MSYIVIYADKYDQRNETKPHYCGEEPGLPISCIIEIRADGPEAVHACMLVGLPHLEREMRFFGDTAKHILGNWLP